MHLDARRRPITSVPTLGTAACVSASGIMVITPQPSSRDVLWGRSRLHLDARRRPSTSVPTPRTDACASPSGHIVITPRLFWEGAASTTVHAANQALRCPRSAPAPVPNFRALVPVKTLFIPRTVSAKTFPQDVLNWENQHAPRLHAVDQSTSVLSCRVT